MHGFAIVFLIIVVYIVCFIMTAIIINYKMNRDRFYKKYDDFLWVAAFPIIPLSILYRKQKLTQFKNMDLKILGKAMGFMFLPTLGVLLMLLVGFFDPIAMWTFIKSDSGWAITVRLIISLAEIILVAIMYDHYNTEEARKKALAGNLEGECKKINYREYIYSIFENPKDDDHFTFHKYTTGDENIIVLERKPK